MSLQLFSSRENRDNVACEDTYNDLSQHILMPTSNNVCFLLSA